MLIPPLPADEPERLAAVRRFAMLDTPAEHDFDDLTLLASNICETPISLITLLDTGRQWFKSRVGLDATETPRTISFCGHAILDKQLFEVPDTYDDQRFVDNPLVVGEPNIRFYAGAPLITSDGYRLGTLCVIDRKPRSLSARQRAALEALSRQVVRQMEARAMAHELRRQGEEVARSEKRLRTITDNVPALIGYIDAGERLRFCNIHYRTMFGFDTEAIVGQTLQEVFGEAMYHDMAPQVAIALTGKRASFERAVVIDGQPGFQQVEYVPDIDGHGKVLGFYALMTDVTARRAAERGLADSEHRLRTITDNLPVAITYVDDAERFRFANATMHAWTGTTPEAVIGRSLREVVGDGLYAERQPYYRRALHGERVEFFKDAHPFHQQRYLQSTFIPDIGEDGKVRGLFTLSNDITALKKTEEELRRLARFDFLTRLPNRAHLYELLPATIERSKRNGSATAVLFLDIDHFKQINDTLGHAKGDRVLQEFAARLQRAVRVTDTVARLAGDEFIVVLECLKCVEAAAQVAEKIIEQMARPWILNGDRLAVTTSIGIAYDAEHALDSNELISRADDALYAAKTGGRNTFRVSGGRRPTPAGPHLPD